MSDDEDNAIIESPAIERTEIVSSDPVERAEMISSHRVLILRLGALAMALSTSSLFVCDFLRLMQS